ncbi:hypothetical protein [Streptomyces sp. NPDC057889]|uniref:hypothetical protein n=1 Tax=unclassified Streptomyces TaxID=2593676 RepID=UPI0036A31EC1
MGEDSELPPRSWGWSAPVTADAIAPAPAGMIRGVRAPPPVSEGRLRACGDGPLEAGEPNITIKSPPRLRWQSRARGACASRAHP